MWMYIRGGSSPLFGTTKNKPGLFKPGLFLIQIDCPRVLHLLFYPERFPAFGFVVFIGIVVAPVIAVAAFPF